MRKHIEGVLDRTVEFISISLEKWYILDIRINWLAVIIICTVIYCLLKSTLIKKKNRTVKIEGFKLGIGDFSCNLVCGSEVQEIAYQLWIELITRKIAIPFEDDDVIIEVYDSWYAAFTAIRELLKSVPGAFIDEASDLIEVTTKVLNEGLRPHLTKWQAAFRAWYNNEINSNPDCTPQEIQRQFPEYEQLIQDIQTTNQNMINFANELHQIAFGKNNSK